MTRSAIPDGELLYDSGRTRILRARAERGPAGSDLVSGRQDSPGWIWKLAGGPGAAERIRHEVSVLRRLAGVPGVVQLAPIPPEPDRFAMLDVNGTTLEAALAGDGQGLGDPQSLIRLAARLARILAAVHAAGVVHGDLSPANILLPRPHRATSRPERATLEPERTPGPVLIDWELATGPGQEAAEPGPGREARTGAGPAADHRSDLYALGATLYTLATGRPPFVAAGPGHPARDHLTRDHLTHDHLAREPLPPRELNPALPAPLSAIIQRLLEPDPDRRYQSAEGLAHDLAALLAPPPRAEPPRPEPHQPEPHQPQPHQPEPHQPEPHQPESPQPEPHQPESPRPELFRPEPSPRVPPPPAPTRPAEGPEPDLLAVLRASQSLAAQTGLERLRARTVQVLAAMTGASSVRLLLWNEDAQDWFLLAGQDAGSTSTGAVIGVGEAARAGLVCLAAVRYAARTREPLLVPDAVRDDRFARDPSLSGAACCSLLVVPLLSDGRPHAMLVLEDRLRAGGFTAQALDTVLLLAGQLTVSLDNALADRFRSLVHGSGELALVSDRGGLISYADSGAQALLGTDPANVVGRRAGEFVHPDDRESFVAWLAAPGPDQRTLQCRILPAYQQPRWAELRCTDLSGDPAVAGLVVHLHDVTERRRLESELQHAQKLEAVGQLAAGIAHEINTPVQFISDNLHFIADAIGPLDTLLAEYRRTVTEAAAMAEVDARRRTLMSLERDADLDFLREQIPLAARQALDGARQVARIVRAMKAFSHSTATERNAYADLNEAVRNTLVVANSEIRPVADVVTELSDLPPIWCNPGDINQALLNIVINAAQAMGEAMGAGRGRGRLTVRTRAEADSALIDVSDTGMGIPDAIAHRVFEQFFTTKPVGVGSGQGLALAYTLIHDRHGGSIRFTSQPGAGTTFTVRLPMSRAGGESAPGEDRS